MDIGRALHYSLQNNISASVIDRGYVLSQWKNENSFPIDYQLSLFCRRLFHEVWEFYPNFFEWVDRKFIPGLINGEREILVMSDNNQILGYAALKKTIKEKKICTLYVKPFARKLGIGSLLLNISKERLQEDRPLITVGEDRVELFSSMFMLNDFKLVGSISDIYENGKKEFIFNKELIIDESAIVDKTGIRKTDF